MRQLIDNIAFANNGFTKVKRGANLDLDAIVNRKPRGFVLVDEMDDFEDVSPQYFGDRVLQVLQYLDEVRENKTGVTKYTQGMDSDSLNKTARGLTQIMAAAQMRIETIARIFAETGVATIIRHFILMNQQFMDRKQTIRLLNRPIDFDPERMRFRFDLVVNVGIGTGNKQQRIQDMQLILQTLLSDPELLRTRMLTPEHRYNIYEAWFKELGRKDYPKFLGRPQPVMPAPAGAEQPPEEVPPEGAQ